MAGEARQAGGKALTAGRGALGCLDKRRLNIRRERRAEAGLPRMKNVAKIRLVLIIKISNCSGSYPRLQAWGYGIGRSL